MLAINIMSFTKTFNHKVLIFAIGVFLGFTFLFSITETKAQHRDHLTKEEIEVVRDVQEVDKRMLVFSRAIDRRFFALKGLDKLDVKEKKRYDKDLHIWGELPKGTQAQLLSDIDKIIEEAINKIEDVSDREVESKLFPVAVHVLSDNAKRYIPSLQKFTENNESRRELSVINSAVANCNLIIEASKKIARPNEKFMKKRTKRIGYTKPLFK